MTIRPATSSDSPAIQRLLEQLGYPDFSLDEVRQNILRHQEPHYHILVGDLNGHVVAFISLHSFYVMHWKKKIGRVSVICVEEAFRSKGVGRQLLHAGEQWLLEQGCAKIELTSNARRIRAHQFYLNLGYIEDSRRFVKYQK